MQCTRLLFSQRQPARLWRVRRPARGLRGGCNQAGLTAGRLCIRQRERASASVRVTQWCGMPCHDGMGDKYGEEAGVRRGGQSVPPLQILRAGSGAETKVLRPSMASTGTESASVRIALGR